MLSKCVEIRRVLEINHPRYYCDYRSEAGFSAVLGDKVTKMIAVSRQNGDNVKTGCATFSGQDLNLDGEVFEGAGLSAVFGGIDMFVPDNINVKINSNSIFGGVSEKKHRPYVENTIQEYIRLYSKANAGSLIIGALYVSTVFVCMALAILSVKTLSTLEEVRRRFSVLYRLGADERMQKYALFRQTGAFFLMPFAFPLLMTVPIGVIFGKVYEIWNLTGLNGQKAMETVLLIALVIAGIYTFYFVITYRIACSHVLCCGGEKQEADI